VNVGRLLETPRKQGLRACFAAEVWSQATARPEPSFPLDTFVKLDWRFERRSPEPYDRILPTYSVTIGNKDLDRSRS
jgi:hypothetical protein